MPTVWIKLAPGSRYAGRYYEGYLPLGDLERSCQTANAVLERPAEELILSPSEPVRDELVDLQAQFEQCLDDLSRFGKQSLTVPAIQTGEAQMADVARLLDEGKPFEAKRVLRMFEDVIRELSKALANVVPVMVVAPGEQPAATPAPARHVGKHVGRAPAPAAEGA